MQERHSVLLYNPISNEGHLDSWHVLFIEVFLEAGWNVIPVSTDPQGLLLKLKSKGLWGYPNLVWSHTEKPETSAFTSNANHLYQRVVRQIKRVFESTAQREQRLLAARFLEPQQFKDTVSNALDSSRGRVDLIFNMFVDGYLPNSSAWNNLVFRQNNISNQAAINAEVHAIPWAGLCITPEYEKWQHTQWPLQALSQAQAQPFLHDKPPSYYALTQYRGTCFLEEAAVDTYRNAFTNKHFTFLPDITDTELPRELNALAIDIKRRAAGRRIVFMGGSIGKQKNLAQWVALILSVDPAQWYFVQVGRISHNNLLPEDTQALARIQQQSPQNLYVHADYLPDETSFNAIIAAANVIFAVYRDFYRSSNMLSKAAYFEKPILVADQCLMGDRVTQYEIGVAVPSDSPERIQAGLIAAVQLPALPAKFARYRADFNRAEFSRRLTSFAATCLTQSRQAA
jgi:UDP:flavonoid glycosyltransferase YjiC (YdhE family)